MSQQKENIQPVAPEHPSIDLEGAVSKIKSKTVYATFGWAIAFVLAFAMGYNTVYVKITAIVNKTGEIDQATETIKELRHRMDMQELKTIQMYSQLGDYKADRNLYAKDFAVITNFDNCDSLKMSRAYIDGLIEEECNK